MNNNIPLEVKENTTLLPFLLDNLRKMSRDNVKSLLRNKQVTVNGQPASLPVGGLMGFLFYKLLAGLA